MLTLISPAKINLFLQIIGRRPDGYHELATLLQTISLVDTIHFSLSSQDQLTCTDPTIPTDHTNLISKAIDLFRRKTGLSFGLKVHLEKNIPHQAGLGGGSSNAATTLWALNELCEKPASETDLIHWAGEIGSDIPSFFSLGTSYCTGRGEIIQSVEKPAEGTFWIVKPNQGASTPAVYKCVDLTKIPKRNAAQCLSALYSSHPQYFNDLEAPAFTVVPALAALKEELLGQGFHTVMLTGSGSGFFCIGDGTPPKRSDLFCQEATFLGRHPGEWYSL